MCNDLPNRPLYLSSCEVVLLKKPVWTSTFSGLCQIWLHLVHWHNITIQLGLHQQHHLCLISTTYSPIRPPIHGTLDRERRMFEAADQTTERRSNQTTRRRPAVMHFQTGSLRRGNCFAGSNKLGSRIGTYILKIKDPTYR